MNTEPNLKEKLLAALRTVKDPELDRDLVALGMVKDLQSDSGNVFLQIEAAGGDADVKNALKSRVIQAIKAVPGVNEVTVQFSAPEKKGPAFQTKSAVPGIRHVIAVASGKGGVGKTTASVNLALALAALGNKVGLMDGDIYGPNVPLMLGILPDARPKVSPEGKIIPIEAQGLKMISMGVLVPADQPMVWRGPMLHSAINQFVQKVDWGMLDFLLVDLPPGTGDVQLSLVQTVALTGAVIVTTPQEVALMDVRKGILMFQKTEVPILGIVENMTGEMFGRGGGSAAAAQFKVPYLGEIPLDVRVRTGGDSGRPVLLSAPESDAAGAFRRAAEVLVENLAKAMV